LKVWAGLKSWVETQDRQAEEDLQALIGISIQEVPEPQFEDFRIVVNKVRRALVGGGVPPLEVIGRIQTLMDDYAADRLILLREHHNDIFDDVGRLVEFRYRAKCWASGDETAFLGQDGARRFKGRINAQAASKRRGTKGPLRRAVERICTKVQANTLDEFLEALEEDAELVPNLYYSLSHPIDLTDVEVDHERCLVRYRIRAQSPASEPKSVSFKRLQTLIAGIG
jgi:hypothetical protein